jgi:signal recognition particle receptor subunit beta
MSKKRSDAENNLERAKEYIRSMSVIDYVYQDIVLFGPRYSGKTSVAKLWTEPAFNIDELSFTTTWKCYERDVLEFKDNDYEKHHQIFNVDIKYRPRLRIRVHDYPGEDRFRLQAVNQLPELKHAVLLFFFTVHADSKGVHTVNDNNSYYSQAFIDSIRRQQDNDLKISKVVVVFNKADLLPASVSLEQAKDMLKERHQDAISRIEGQFSGKLEYIVVSARDNRGLISLLGAAGSSTLPTEVKKRFDEGISRMALQAQQKPN